MMKRRLILFSAFIICAGLLLSGCSREETVSSYERDILGKITEDIGEEGRLPGFSEDICVIDGAKHFDETRILANYAGLFNETDHKVLYQKGATEKLYPASMTKMMTALLVAEHCEDLTEMVTVTEEALQNLPENSSIAGLQAGERYTVSDLLYALLVPSGNDAANVLAIHVSGSVEAFVALMNERAKELGMLGTHFVNPNGLHDKNHYTTVYDLYLLMRAFVQYPKLCDAASSKEASGAALQPDGSYALRTWRSTNSFLLGYVEMSEDLSLRAAKTGYTQQAGRCMAVYVNDSEGKDYFAVIGSAASYDVLYQEVNNLLSIISEQ